MTTRAQAPAQEQQTSLLMSRLTKSRWSLAVLGLVVLGVLLRLPTIGYALNEPMAFFPFRQTQTAIVVREYMRNGLSLSSPLTVLGPPWDVPLEFPVYQWIAALVGTGLGWTDTLAARVTCLVFFEITAVLLAVLARRWFSTGAALVALALFQVLPFGYVYGSASSIEFLPTAALLGAILAVDTWVNRAEGRRRVLLVLAGLLLVIGSLAKITTALPWVVVYLAVLVSWGAAISDGRLDLRSFWTGNRDRLAGLIPVASGIVAGIAWTRYSDAIKAQSFYTEFLTSTNLTWWTFGTWEQRLRTQNWAAPVEWSGSITGPGLLLFMIALAAILLWPKRRPITLALALAFPISVAVFFNLYVVHNYYLSAVYPALVLIAAAAIVGAARLASTRSTQAIVGGALCFVLLAAAWLSPQGQLISQRTKDAPFNYSQSVEITQHTAPDDGVILVGCGWSSEILYFADRRGLMVQNVWPPFTDTRLIPYSWLGTDLDYVYLCDPSTANLTPLFPPEVSLEPVTANLLRIVP